MTIDLPLAPAEVDLVVSASGAARTSDLSFAGQSVLVVDDDAAVRQVLVEMLARLGVTAVAVGGGRAALQQLKVAGNQFKVVITDVDMPEVNGLELMNAINDSGIGVPVILMSGSRNPGTEVRNRGGLRFLPKPFTFEELKRVLEAVQLAPTETDFAAIVGPTIL